MDEIEVGVQWYFSSRCPDSCLNSSSSVRLFQLSGNSVSVFLPPDSGLGLDELKSEFRLLQAKHFSDRAALSSALARRSNFVSSVKNSGAGSGGRFPFLLCGQNRTVCVCV